MTSDSKVVGKEPCPTCGSRDNLVRYSDGHAHCFGCRRYERSVEHATDNGEQSDRNGKRMDNTNAFQVTGEFTSLTARAIRQDTCEFFNYRIGEASGKPAQLAYYYDDNRKPIAYKARFADKSFASKGDISNAMLFGQQLWTRDGGKMIVVTEGEIDCMSVSQLQNNKWPVVSIPNGAQGAKKALQRSYEFLDKYETIILMFDMDDAGQAAAKECAELFEPAKVKIAHLPLKDANACLQAGKGAEVISAIWNAITFRPDGIIQASDLWDLVSTEDIRESMPYPWEFLNTKIHGLRRGELVTVTAGSGIGKSAIVREIAYSLLKSGETVGMIMLEESVRRTAEGIMGLELDLPLHISKEGVTADQLRMSFDKTLGTHRLYLYDHFGSTEVNNLLNRIRYMAKALNTNWIILDHLSIVVSGLEGDDERRLIDRAMTLLRTLVEETGIGLILVSHLKRPSGMGHEDGAQTSLSQLRGSAAIGQLSDIVIGAERDQQGEDPNRTVIRILKDRFSGSTGEAGSLFYNNVTGRLTEVEPVTQMEF